MTTWPELANEALTDCIDVLGIPITYTPDDGSDPVNIQGILRTAYMAIDPESGAEFQSNQVYVGVLATDLPGEPAKGDQVTGNGITYRVIESKTDGHAGYRLFLQKV